MNKSQWHADTMAIRSVHERTMQQEHSEPLFLTSSFIFDDAEQAADHFSGSVQGNVYARFTNPNAAYFIKRLAGLESAEYGIATASGMAAILTLNLAHLSAGEQVICADSVFGSTASLYQNVFSKFGVETRFVPLEDLDAWEQAITPKTKLLFCETPSNPNARVADIEALSELAHANQALLVVDNCFCTPMLQKPLTLGADVVMHSATKFIDGQGRCLGGALLTNDAAAYESYFNIIRTCGTSLSAFNAWVLSKSLETLSVRMKQHCVNAQALAEWLEGHPAVQQVNYPGLASHPQRALVEKQQSAGGAVLSFLISGGRAEAWSMINGCQLLSKTANLGDTRSTITHPLTTTHARLPDALKQQSGIVENMIRISVGLEHIDDLKNDLAQAFEQISSL